MSKRTIIAIFLALLVTIAATAMWSAGTVERDGDTDANVMDDSGALTGNSGDTKKGNKVVRLAQPLGDGETIHPGKHDVEHQGVKAFAAIQQASQSIFTIFQDLNRMTFCFQVEPQTLRQVSFIFDHQYPAHVR